MSLDIVMVVYPDMTQLDFTAPFEVFARLPEARIEVAWKTTKPVRDAAGLKIVPSAKFSRLERCDVLFVPGGPGQLALMEDAETLAFLRRMAGTARYVTSVCTGSLILAAAGLLTGYRATCHWMSLDQLAHMGAVPVRERVVVDRNRITGAGVTSGLDFALAMAQAIAGEPEARRISLAIEYDPKPPFPGPAEEDPHLVAEVLARTAVFQQRRDDVARAVGARMGNAHLAPGGKPA
ncbi:MAG: thiamine biosynthesis protein ThiJ [Rhizobiales bacterium 32-66-8]|nr:MAG: thiamine biosynthesis protein ThiJ [Rhizobiales bacterium 32-66-8]